MTLHTQLPIYKTGVELSLARQARRRLMTTKTNPLPPLPEPLCNLPAYCRDAINSYAESAVREALAAQPSPAALTDADNLLNWLELADAVTIGRANGTTEVTAIFGDQPIISEHESLRSALRAALAALQQEGSAK